MIIVGLKLDEQLIFQINICKDPLLYEMTIMWLA